MQCKFPYNENFVAFAKKDVGGNGSIILNFAWLYVYGIFVGQSAYPILDQ